MGTPIGELISKKPLNWADLNNRRIGIDSHNMLYQFLSNIRSVDGTPLMDSHGQVTSHLTGLLYRVSGIVEQGVSPVFVFDGKPHELKAKTLEARRKIKTEAGEKLEKARLEGNLEDMRKFSSMTTRLTPEILESSQELIQLLGYPVVQAPCEGEAQLAFMVSRGDLFAGVSQDYDALLFGCSRLIRNMAFSGKRKVPGRNVYIDVEPEYLELESVLKSLGISRQQLIWLGILVGTDFNDKFPRIGPKTALKIVQSCDSLDAVLKYTDFSPQFDAHAIESIFLKPDHTEKYHLDFSVPSREKLVSFLVDRHDFSLDRVNAVLDRLEKKRNEKGSQSRLGDWN